MSLSCIREADQGSDQVPPELCELKEKIQAQPPMIRAQLEPLVEDALEHARFRGRVMGIAKEALERFRLDLAMMEFDLDATRKEREALKERLRF
jgi:hypothetical protein